MRYTSIYYSCIGRSDALTSSWVFPVPVYLLARSSQFRFILPFLLAYLIKQTRGNCFVEWRPTQSSNFFSFFLLFVFLSLSCWSFSFNQPCEPRAQERLSVDTKKGAMRPFERKRQGRLPHDAVTRLDVRSNADGDERSVRKVRWMVSTSRKKRIRLPYTYVSTFVEII